MFTFRRFLALTMALVCILSVWTVRAEEDPFPCYGAATAAVRVYAEPDVNSKLLAVIPKGSQVMITGESGSYYVVLYNAVVGYAPRASIQLSGSARQESVYPELSKGSKGEHVTALQQALKELGFYTSAIDGQFGSGTYRAVIAFQKANGQKQTGKADTTLQVLLYEGKPKNSKNTAVSVKTAPAVTSYTLAAGNTGVAVEKLQSRLKELGYYTRTVDGVFGSSTATALKAFQKANGLMQSGKADYSTQLLLYGGNTSVIAKLTATPKVKKTATPSPTAEPKATYPFTTYTLAAVNLRKAASVSSTRLATVPKGAEISVSSVDSDFVKATYQGKTGYLAAEFVKIPTQYLPGKLLSTDSDAQQHYPTLQSGSSGQYVSVLQEALKELGFYTGTVSGSFDSATVTALKAFQKKNAIRQDGIATPEVQKLILEGRPLNAKGKKTDVKILPLIDNIDLRQGDKGSAVARLQEQLIAVGVYTGEATGVFNAATDKAVREFQTRHSLYVDGVVGKKTRQLLNLLTATATPRAGAATPTPAPAGTALPAPTETPITAKNVVVMRSGTKGEAVKRLQERLMELRYYTCTVDGVYNADEIAAVKEFQRKNGLKIDGIAGLETQLCLYSDDALPATTAALITFTPQPTVKVTPKATAKATATPVSTTLRIGSSGSSVKTLQQKLKDLGYYTGKVDGVFGTATAQAVTSFQKNNKLTADGVAGPKTLAKLNSANAAASAQAATPTPTPAAVKLLRSGDQGADVKAMQKRLVELGYLNAADGIYGIRTYNAVVAFQKRNNLTADGVAGTMTLNRLNSSSAIAASAAAQPTVTPTNVVSPSNPSGGSFKAPSASEVINANWYSEIRARAKLMPDVVIYDPETKLHFNLHMFSFGKHADSEPPTAADTDVLNQICGVNSWTPHYVWVIFSDGRVYIGSIHSHGHSVDHTTGNNLDGHICLHFPRVMSEAEETGPYAVSHQKEILYGWEVTQAMAK